MTRRASTVGGLKVKGLTQTARAVGLSPAWHCTFLVIFSFNLKSIFISYKYQIPGTAIGNNLPFTPATSNTHIGEAATSLNLHSPPRDSLELIILSDASQNSTIMQCYFYHLWKCFLDYFNDQVPDDAVIYTGDVPFQYNKQEGMCSEFLGGPKGNIS